MSQTNINQGKGDTMMIKRVMMIAVFCLFSSAALADNCSVEIEGNDAMQFNKNELTVGAGCSEITVTLKHVGNLPKATMGHGLVITTAADMQAVANAGIAAGIDNNHVPPGDDRVIAASKLVGGGETTTLTIPGSKFEAGGDYMFFCPFPGHNAMMKGKFIVQ
jgi:azurin